MGPLVRFRSGCSYLSTVTDISGCLSTVITDKPVIKALSQFLSVFGIPKIIDRSRVKFDIFAQLLQWLHVKLNMVSCHPQSQSALEHFHRQSWSWNGKGVYHGFCWRPEKLCRKVQGLVPINVFTHCVHTLSMVFYLWCMIGGRCLNPARTW